MCENQHHQWNLLCLHKFLLCQLRHFHGHFDTMLLKCKMKFGNAAYSAPYHRCADSTCANVKTGVVNMTDDSWHLTANKITVWKEIWIKCQLWKETEWSDQSDGLGPMTSSPDLHSKFGKKWHKIEGNIYQQTKETGNCQNVRRVRKFIHTITLKTYLIFTNYYLIWNI